MYSMSEAAVCITNCLSKDLHMLLNFLKSPTSNYLMKNNE